MTQTATVAAPPPPGYELRPLSTGEILDRTFALYRQRFWLYAGLGAIAACFTTLGTFARLTWGISGVRVTPQTDTRAAIVGAITTLVTAFIYFLAYSITQAATTSAVSAVYLGRETSIGAALGGTRRHWLRTIGIVFWQTWSAMWLPVLLGVLGLVGVSLARFGVRWLGVTLLVLAGLSVFYAPFAYIRNALGIVACVMEDLSVRRSMRRSKDLIGSRVWRVFALLLLMYALYIVAGVVQGTATLGMVQTHGWKRALLETITLLATFGAATLIAPVGAIGLCLFYIDERVRREGFDVETLMERAGGPPVAAPLGRGEDVPVVDAVPEFAREEVAVVEPHVAERV